MNRLITILAFFLCTVPICAQLSAIEMNKKGDTYYYGKNGVAQNYAEAVKWYRKAADKGLAVAQFNLGICYTYDIGVDKNYAEAVKWYRKAANQGLAIAQFYLGYYLNIGQGVTQNYVEAVKWYQKAAGQGLADAQYNLGICYEIGQGVTQNYTEAAKWYRKAAAQGHTNAKTQLVKLEKSQTPVSKSITETTDSHPPKKNPQTIKQTTQSSSATEVSQKRLALVIGNSDYPDGRLANPVNDARDISAKLKSLGFDVMSGTTNLNYEQMIRTIMAFCEKASRYDVALFFYAGHAVQYQGINYLMPSNVRISDSFIPQLNVSFEEILMKRLEESGVKVKIAVLDACRNKPTRVDNSKRGYSDNGVSAIGLNPAAAPRGTFLVFSTQSGEEADDGKDAKHSPFTSVLLEEIDKPGVPILTMFDKVRRLVDEKTNHKQSPFIIPNMFGEDFYFNP